MRKALKFCHTLASCGMIGGLACYLILLHDAPQDSAARYADVRQTISVLASYVLVPSLGIVLVSGLVAMIVHRPFQHKGWVWIKAASGLLLFESTLALIQAKANYLAQLSREVADGTVSAAAMAPDLATEQTAIWAITAIAVSNIVLGVWRPVLRGRRSARTSLAPPADEAA